MKNNIRALRFEKFKEILHPVLIKAMGAKTTGELEVEGEFPTDDNYLIVANHACIEDIPTLGQAVQKHFYLLVSDEDKNTIDGLALDLNGVIWIHRTDNISRKEAYGQIVELLKKGKTFAMYPEATWNLSPNQLMMPMNYGCIKIALESGKKIVPVVTFFNKDKRYTKIGTQYAPTEDLIASIDELRDQMATMMYELIQKKYEREFGKNPNVKCCEIDGKKYYHEKREAMHSHMWDKNIFDRYNAYGRARKDMTGVREFESQFIFTPKDEAHQFFQEYNSVVLFDENTQQYYVKRITSENNGYQGMSFGEEEKKESFGFGYNEKVLQRTLKK